MTSSEVSSQCLQAVPRLPLLSSREKSRGQALLSSRGQRMLAEAAKELSGEARDGSRPDGSVTERRMSGIGLSLDLDAPRRFSQTVRSLPDGLHTPRDIMASGPQTLTVAAARGRRKGVHTGVCLAKASPEERRDHELRQICEQIGLKAAQKFSTVRQAFRYLDADHDGKISRSEMQYFFRAYNFPDQIADRFYDRLDHDGSGEVEYSEFMKYIAPYVQPAQFGANHSMPEWCSSSNASTRTPSPLGCTSQLAADGDHLAAPASQAGIGPEIQATLEFIGTKSKEKFSHARKVFRCVDCNDDGSISRKEMRYFFRVFNLSEDKADKVFDHLAHCPSEEVNYHEFVRFLGPFLDLPGTQAAMLQRPDAQPAPNRPSRRASLASSQRAGSVANSSRRSSISDASEVVDASVAHKADEHTQAQLEKEMRHVMKDIGEKLPLKFKHVREAFRPLDLSHNGKITRGEMRSFLRGFGWPHVVADRFFAILDEDSCGAINFNSFVSHFDVALGPANRLASRGDLVNVEDRQVREDANRVASILGEKLLTKCGAREALRTLDLSNDGKITFQDMRLFFRTMCLPHDAATKMFKSLCKDGADFVEYDDFLALFGTVQKGGGRWRTLEALKGSARPSQRGSCDFSEARFM